MTGFIVLALYAAAFFVGFLVIRRVAIKSFELGGFNAQKTVTFGDESAVKANRIGSVISVLWCSGFGWHSPIR